MRRCRGLAFIAALTIGAVPASAQTLSRLVPSLVLVDVPIGAGPPGLEIPGIPHTAHFSPLNPLFGELDAPTQTLLTEQLQLIPQLNRQINAQLSTFPLGSSSGGFTFRFDPELGTFSRSSTSFGALLTERALTLGRGQFSYGMVYQHVSYDRFEGHALKNPELTFYYPHNDCCPGQSTLGVPVGNGTLLTPFFEGDVLRNAVSIDLRTNTTAFFANIGVSNRLDIGVAVPLVDVRLAASVERTIMRFATTTNPLIHSFDNAGGDTETSQASGTSFGVGDVLVRAKHQLVARNSWAVSGAGELRLPTGDETELLGTGAMQGRLAALVSIATGPVSLHGNLGYTWAGSVPDSSAEAFVVSPSNEANYSIGADSAIHPRVTAAFEIYGRVLRDVDRLTEAPLAFRFTTLAAPTQQQTTTVDGFGVESGNMHTALGAAGLKINVARTLLLNTGLLFSLTDGGLHNRTTATVGLDYTFGR